MTLRLGKQANQIVSLFNLHMGCWLPARASRLPPAAFCEDAPTQNRIYNSTVILFLSHQKRYAPVPLDSTSLLLVQVLHTFCQTNSRLLPQRRHRNLPMHVLDENMTERPQLSPFQPDSHAHHATPLGSNGPGPPGVHHKCSPADKRGRRVYRWKIILGLVGPFALQSLDITIIASALPFIAKDFGWYLAIYVHHFTT